MTKPWFFLCLCFFSVSQFALADRISVGVHAEAPRSLTEWKGEWWEVPGYPRVPTVFKRILLPYGMTLGAVRITHVRSRQDVRSFPSVLVPFPKTLCGSDWPAAFPHLFRGTDAYPQRELGTIQVVVKHGFRIAEIPVLPLILTPARGTGQWTEEIDLEVQTVAAAPEAVYRGLPADRAEVARLVDNPDVISTYPARAVRTTAQYLVIGPEAMLGNDALLMLLENKASHGLTTQRLAIENIDSQFPGADLQEKIRSAIIDRYRHAGTQYVLLLGNGYSVLPSRQYDYSGDSIASDTYYSCLDGAGTSDSLDAACEVAVGRAPVNDNDELTTFVAKTLYFDLISANDPRTRNVLGFGEVLDDATLAGDLIEHLFSGGNAGSISTTGYPSDFKVTRLYEHQGRTFSAGDILQALNSGDFYTVNHMGHANERYCMRFSSDDISQLTNPLPFFSITQGCHPGNLNGPNWASQMVTHPGGGAAAIIANSGFGYYSQGDPNDGPSNRHHLLFYDSVFHEGIQNIGKANNRAKERLIPQLAANPFLQYVVRETNLLGDPELRLKVGKTP